MESLRHDQSQHLNDTASSPSPEMFSFPGTPSDDQSEFEFGSCIAPDSPPMLMSSSDHSLSKNIINTTTLLDQLSSTSPADQFFLNGRLLPHEFPVVHSTRTSFSGRENMGGGGSGGGPASSAVTLSRGTSAKSSISISSISISSSSGSIKDYSLVSSRSNSTNSSSCSTCASTNSARISSSEVSDKKPFQKKMMQSLRERKSVSSSPLGQYYKYGSSGSSQRWQFITAAPVLGSSRSRRGRTDGIGAPTTSPKLKRDVGCKEKRGSDSNSNQGSLFYKILKSVVATCKACHAMEGQDKEFELEAVGDVMGH